jgi:predicted nucleic-acid-binding protein
MIGLDTNILVRYLAQDDPSRSAKAREVIEERLTDENPGFVSIAATAETVWVLERAYKLTSLEIARAVERILQTDVLVVEKRAGGFHSHDRSQEGTRLVRRCGYHSTWHKTRLFPNADI